MSKWILQTGVVCFNSFCYWKSFLRSSRVLRSFSQLEFWIKMVLLERCFSAISGLPGFLCLQWASRKLWSGLKVFLINLTICSCFSHCHQHPLLYTPFLHSTRLPTEFTLNLELFWVPFFIHSSQDTLFHSLYFMILKRQMYSFCTVSSWHFLTFDMFFLMQDWVKWEKMTSLMHILYIQNYYLSGQ